MLNKFLIVLLSSAFMLSCGDSKKKSDSDEEQPKGRILEYSNTLDFINEEGNVITTLRFEKADSESERNQGLMDVNSMPSDAGMVFYFENEQPRSFWMANTPLPLDIMYVNTDSIIVSIYKNTVPFSEQSLPSGEPAKYVIETNAGFSVNYDIKEGIKVRF